MDLSLIGQLTLNGILIGLVYALIGLGLSLVLGVMGVLNISHGALYMMGGYLAYQVTVYMDLSPAIGVIAAVAGVFLVGLLIERLLIEPVSNDTTSVMLITFGLAIILSQVALLVWGGFPLSNRALSDSTLALGKFYAQTQIVISAIIGLMGAGLLVLFLRKTKYGKAMRMVSQNREAARTVGISSTRIAMLALAIGSSFAGLAGALLTPIYLVNASTTQWSILIAAFVVVIIGGLGSVKGSVIGGLIYGILQTVGDVLIPSGSDILVLVLIIAIILVRPSGLFGSRDRI